ncbi:MAG: DUF3536 domain-containing protein [bacterium]
MLRPQQRLPPAQSSGDQRFPRGDPIRRPLRRAPPPAAPETGPLAINGCRGTCKTPEAASATEWPSGQPNQAALSAGPLPSDSGKIEELVNNYALISFNFGPTLLSWLEKHSLHVYMSILEADRISAAARSGHGNAMAQAYNHAIMPLATLRDKRTQVKWGEEYFSLKFGRKPEGMWLPETAADCETLEILCEHDIRFTVLSPSQAARFRRIGSDSWENAAPSGFDTARPYRWFSKARPGRFIDIFFYYAPIAQEIAFHALLDRPCDFAKALLSAFKNDKSPQLAHFAANGETYGHHYRTGHISLAAALREIEKSREATLTNYGEFLEKHPPVFEVEIISPSAWSCRHGVGRWKENCGCRVHNRPGWSQQWRAPLREAMNVLAEAADSLYEEKSSPLLADPWQARTGYISRADDKAAFGVKKFLSLHSRKRLSTDESRQVLLLMELQRNRMQMFASCGWFSDEISGIESAQIMKYASRVIELARCFGTDLEGCFLEKLEKARSNLDNFSDGRTVYEIMVKPLRVDMKRAAAHYCLLNFLGGGLSFSTHCRFHFKILAEEKTSGGEFEVCSWHISVETSDTLEHAVFSAAAVRGKKCSPKPRQSGGTLHVVPGTAAGQSPYSPARACRDAVQCHVKECATPEEHGKRADRIRRAALDGDEKVLHESLEMDFDPEPYDLSAVFADQRAVLAILAGTKDEGTSSLYREWFRQIKSFDAGKGLSEKMLQLLRQFHKTGISYREVPFLDDVRGYFTGRFGLLLERRCAEELAASLPWLEFFNEPPFSWGAWEFRLIFWKWLTESSYSPESGDDMSAPVKETAKTLNLRLKHHGHKKITA